MAITISFGIQKGGVGKTTTTAITAFLLAKEAKVLAVDFDSQGNLTYFLTQKNIYDFHNNTVLQACKEKDPRPYIYEISEKLHILPAEDFLALFAQYVHREYKGNPATLLKETLDVVKEDYDYILIDLPPNLGDQTINGLTASDFAVTLLQSEPFCYEALDRYLEFLVGVKEKANSKLQLAGILGSMFDSRTLLDKGIIEKAKEEYEQLMFNVTIKKRSRIKEFVYEGIGDKYTQDRIALNPYKKFVKELLSRVKGKSVAGTTEQ